MSILEVPFLSYKVLSCKEGNYNVLLDGRKGRKRSVALRETQHHITCASWKVAAGQVSVTHQCKYISMDMKRKICENFAETKSDCCPETRLSDLHTLVVRTRGEG